MAILHVGSQSLQKLDFSRDLDLEGDFKHLKPPIKPTCGLIFRRLDPMEMHGGNRSYGVIVFGQDIRELLEIVCVILEVSTSPKRTQTQPYHCGPFLRRT